MIDAQELLKAIKVQMLAHLDEDHLLYEDIHIEVATPKPDSANYACLHMTGEAAEFVHGNNSYHVPCALKVALEALEYSPDEIQSCVGQLVRALYLALDEVKAADSAYFALMGWTVTPPVSSVTELGWVCDVAFRLAVQF